jgi:hypothetical protein
MTVRDDLASARSAEERFCYEGSLLMAIDEGNVGRGHLDR